MANTGLVHLGLRCSLKAKVRQANSRLTRSLLTDRNQESNSATEFKRRQLHLSSSLSTASVVLMRCVCAIRRIPVEERKVYSHLDTSLATGQAASLGPPLDLLLVPPSRHEPRVCRGNWNASISHHVARLRRVWLLRYWVILWVCNNALGQLLGRCLLNSLLPLGPPIGTAYRRQVERLHAGNSSGVEGLGICHCVGCVMGGGGGHGSHD